MRMYKNSLTLFAALHLTLYSLTSCGIPVWIYPRSIYYVSWKHRDEQSSSNHDIFTVFRDHCYQAFAIDHGETYHIYPAIPITNKTIRGSPFVDEEGSLLDKFYTSRCEFSISTFPEERLTMVIDTFSQSSQRFFGIYNGNSFSELNVVNPQNELFVLPNSLDKEYHGTFYSRNNLVTILAMVETPSAALDFTITISILKNEDNSQDKIHFNRIITTIPFALAVFILLLAFFIWYLSNKEERLSDMSSLYRTNKVVPKPIIITPKTSMTTHGSDNSSITLVEDSETSFSSQGASPSDSTNSGTHMKELRKSVEHRSNVFAMTSKPITSS